MKKKTNEIFIAILIPLLALAFPLVLIPIEKIIFFQYSYLAEELAKALFVLIILKLPDKIFRIKLAVTFGIFFTLSESFFYLSSFSAEPANFLFLSFFGRIIITGALHILTTLVILIPTQSRIYFFPLALFAAMLIHYFYNNAVTAILKLL